MTLQTFETETDRWMDGWRDWTQVQADTRSSSKIKLYIFLKADVKDNAATYNAQGSTRGSTQSGW